MNLGRVEERLAPLDGIAAVVLWVAGVVVLQGPADQPDTDAAPATALAFFKEHHDAILLGTFLYMLGTLFFLWFLGLVRAEIGPAEGGTRRLSSIAYAAGIVLALTQLLMPAVHATGAINRDHLSPDAAQVYLGLGADVLLRRRARGGRVPARNWPRLALHARIPDLARVGQHGHCRVAADPANRLACSALRLPALADRG
jgi:hypothetical protein